MKYRGRFAPSPSGPLHMGSLVCALASYLDAKCHKGQWLVRIEDIDPPREVIGASEKILQSLQAHHLYWDEDVVFQSQRGDAYKQALTLLQKSNFIYRCHCTRKRLQALAQKGSPTYDGLCLKHPPNAQTPCALRLNLAKVLSALSINMHSPMVLKDNIANHISEAPLGWGDFIVHRKDGHYAYHLAVVVDDIAQNITHIVRGDDLIDCTLKQKVLTQALTQKRDQESSINAKELVYSHIPVLRDAKGNKLSKQNHAPAINNDLALANLIEACAVLGLNTTAHNHIPTLLLQAVEQWSCAIREKL